MHASFSDINCDCDINCDWFDKYNERKGLISLPNKIEYQIYMPDDMIKNIQENIEQKSSKFLLYV